MQLRILPSAFGDLERGKDFYAQHGPELGDYFVDALIADIDSLALYAGIHMKIWGFHRMLARRFPYAIYYQVDHDICIIWRVLDCRQRPSRMRRALSSK
ncbi:MAG: type II toxin-antitoxin system RelE/ParE family toxin [Proteobacteria bacterium]|nr:type II toxin-antitoxin system RelE/ParE family toxin [Pseudomonadota bacterium]